MSGENESQQKDDSALLLSKHSTSQTREGSFTPQWMQKKSFDTVMSGSTTITTTNAAEREKETIETHSNHINEEKGGESNGQKKQQRMTDDKKERTSNMTSDLRRYNKKDNDRRDSIDTSSNRHTKWSTEGDSWKTKERWAAGPDTSKSWLDVQSTNRQKDGWMSSNGMSRSYGDRWNTDGGRWTDERKKDDKDYVPKNARWNDEERSTDSWKEKSSSKQDSNNNKNRFNSNSRQTDTGRRMSVDQKISDEIRNLYDGPDKNTTNKLYSKKEMLDIYDTLLQKLGSSLPIPESADTSCSGFFKNDLDNTLSKTGDDIESKNDQLIEKDNSNQKMATLDEKTSSKEFLDDKNMNKVSQTLLPENYMYKDREGNVHGPFNKKELYVWWDNGYFPRDLPIKPSNETSNYTEWKSIEEYLPLWKISFETNPNTSSNVTETKVNDDNAIKISNEAPPFNMNDLTSQHIPLSTIYHAPYDSTPANEATNFSNLNSNASNLQMMKDNWALFQKKQPLDSQQAFHLLFQNQKSQQALNVGSPHLDTALLNLTQHQQQQQQSQYALGQAQNPSNLIQNLNMQNANPSNLQNANNIVSPELLSILQQQRSGLAQQSFPTNIPRNFDTLLVGGLNAAEQQQQQQNRLQQQFPPFANANAIYHNQQRQGLFEKDSTMQSEIQKLLQTRGLVPNNNPLAPQTPEQFAAQQQQQNTLLNNPQLQGIGVGNVGQNWATPGLLNLSNPQFNTNNALAAVAAGRAPQQAQQSLQNQQNNFQVQLQLLSDFHERMNLQKSNQVNRFPAQNHPLGASVLGSGNFGNSMNIFENMRGNGRGGVTGNPVPGLSPMGMVNEYQNRQALQNLSSNSIQSNYLAQLNAGQRNVLNTSNAQQQQQQQQIQAQNFLEKLQNPILATSIPPAPPPIPSPPMPTLSETEISKSMDNASTVIISSALSIPSAINMNSNSSSSISMTKMNEHVSNVEESQVSSKEVSEAQKARPATNPWGVTLPSSSMTSSSVKTSLRDIQESEADKNSQSTGLQDGKLSAMPLQHHQGSVTNSWNAPQQVKAKPMKDIMEEDEAEKKKIEESKKTSSSGVVPPSNNVTATTTTGFAGRSLRELFQSPAESNNKSGVINGPQTFYNTSLSSASKPSSIKPVVSNTEDGFWDMKNINSNNNHMNKDVTLTPWHDPDLNRSSPNQSQESVTIQQTTSGTSGMFPGATQISKQFQNWCQEQMKSISGSKDITLIEFLMSLKGRSEVVEYIQEHFKLCDKDKVAKFTKEFMKRKETDHIQLQKEKEQNNNSKNRKKNTKVLMISKDVVEATVAPPPPPPPPSSLTTTTSSSDNIKSNLNNVNESSSSQIGWEKVGGNSSNNNNNNSGKGKESKGGKKSKGKKQVKGQSVPVEMLGFKSSYNHEGAYKSGRSNN